MADRRTTIDGDQLTNHTVQANDFETVDNIDTPKPWQVLLFDAAQNKMKWFYTFGNKILK